MLGLNSISEVTVNTLSYSVDQGRYGASQVNYVTKSGTNQFHGNLYELWNGSALNAADYFTNATPGNHKPRSTVNHFGGSLGGPILHDKLFFFFDSEWVRIALPIVTPPPSPRRVSELRPAATSLGGTDSVTGAVYPAAPQLVPFYQKMFSLYGNTSGTPLAVLGCPFNADGSRRRQSAEWKRLRQPAKRFAFERRPRAGPDARIDYNINAEEHAWFRFQADTGLQAAYTDPINPLFNAHLSAAALLVRGRLHARLFAEPGELFQSRIFLVSKPVRAQRFPEDARGISHRPARQRRQRALHHHRRARQHLGAGRRASRFFINDNLAWSHGAHEFRFGTNTRIFRLNDYDFGEGTVPRSPTRPCRNSSTESPPPPRRPFPCRRTNPSIS